MEKGDNEAPTQNESTLVGEVIKKFSYQYINI